VDGNIEGLKIISFHPEKPVPTHHIN